MWVYNMYAVITLYRTKIYIGVYMKTAVIDIGSNTIKLDIFDVSGKEATVLSSQSEKGALARHTKGGFLTDEGYETLKNILEKYLIAAVCDGCEKTYVFATQSLRNISNSEEVRHNIKEALGADIDIISGEEEALCSTKALMLDCPDAENGIMADMGGGSLELVEFENRIPVGICSLPLGALRVKELLGIGIIPTSRDEEKIKTHVNSIFKTAPVKSRDTVYLIGGTARSVFSLCFDGKDEISPCDAAKAYRRLADGGEESENLFIREIPKRADNFMTGFYIFNMLCEYYGIKKIVLCQRGVRDGYLLNKTENGNT